MPIYPDRKQRHCISAQDGVRGWGFQSSKYQRKYQLAHWPFLLWNYSMTALFSVFWSIFQHTRILKCSWEILHSHENIYLLVLYFPSHLCPYAILSRYNKHKQSHIQSPKHDWRACGCWGSFCFSPYELSDSTISMTRNLWGFHHLGRLHDLWERASMDFSSMSQLSRWPQRVICWG